MKPKIPKKETILFCFAITGIAICIAIQIMTLYSTNKTLNRLPVDATIPDNTPVMEKELLQTKAIYKLYECGGKIGIYDADSDTIVDIIDIFVSTLPKSDRAALKKGVEIFSFSELSQIIDDFTS